MKQFPVMVLLATFRVMHVTVCAAENEDGFNSTSLAFPSVSLFHAVQNRDLDSVKKRLQSDCDASNERDAEGWPPLHWAARNGDNDMINLLIDHGANVNAELRNGTTALQWASWAGEDSAVQTLIQRGASVNHRDSSLRWTALHWAAAASNAAAQHLLNAGAEIGIRGKEGFIPLHLAVLHNKTDIVSLLIEKGSVIGARDSDRHTPLHLASIQDNLIVAKILLDHGANPNVEDDTASPLQYAAAHGNVDFIELLLEKGADVNLTCQVNGMSALHFAVSSDSLQAAELLLNKGANVNAASSPTFSGGITPLHLSASRGFNQMIEVLLKHGAKINATDGRGRTAVMLAIEGGHQDTVDLLLRNGAASPPNVTDGQDESDGPRIRLGIFGIPGGLGGDLADLADRLIREAANAPSDSDSAGPQAGKSRFERVRNVTTRFEDVAGCDEAKTELEDIVAFLRDPSRFTRLGGRMNRGVLLSGSPGTGKTLLAKAVAGEAGVPFFYAAGSDFDEVYAGLGAARVRELFSEARRETPCIIFIDEIDAVGSRRAARADRQDSRQTLNQLLAELDGFKTGEGVVVLAATNMPDVLDPALTRPGRFDRLVAVPLPDQAARAAVLRVHLRGVMAGQDVDAALLARATPGFSGADLAGIVNQAALAAAKAGRPAVTMADLEMAKDRHLMGAERPGANVPARSRKATAFHEAGHALVASLMPGALPVYRITVVPRGRSLGMVTQLPEDGGEYRSTSRLEYIAAVTVCMGGRAAEELVYGMDSVTDGAARDLEQATNMAAAMVERYGMGSGTPVSLVADADPWWHGGSRRSERARSEVDQEVQRIVAESHERALRLLEDHFNVLHTLAAELIARGSMSGDDLRTLLRSMGIRVPAGPIDPTPRVTLDARRCRYRGVLASLLAFPTKLAVGLMEAGFRLLPTANSGRSVVDQADVFNLRRPNATGGLEVASDHSRTEAGDACQSSSADGASLLLRVSGAESRAKAMEEKLDLVLTQLSTLHNLLSHSSSTVAADDTPTVPSSSGTSGDDFSLEEPQTAWAKGISATAT